VAGSRRAGLARAGASAGALAGLLTAVTAGALAIGCRPERRPAPATRSAAPPADPLAPLRAFERARRAGADFLAAPPADRALGADPYDVAALPDGRGAVGILRGRDALARLDAEAIERARVPTPRAPSAVTVYEGADRGVLRRGDVLVASELEPALGHYRVTSANSLERLADVPLPDVRAARDVATGPEGAVYVVEEHDHTLVTLAPDGHVAKVTPLPLGPIRLVRTRDAVHVLCLLAHAIVTLPVDRDGVPGAIASRVSLDGPFWGFDALDLGPDGAQGTLLVATGVEDHPLDRRGGFFGYVDSFVYVYLRRPGEAGFTRTAAIDASARGVLVPKAVALAPASASASSASASPSAPASPTAVVAAYGSAHALRLAWPDGPSSKPSVEVADSMPGTSALARLGPSRTIGADPLVDAWIRVDATSLTTVHVADRAGSRRDPLARLGEALFFTELMAPADKADGALSRFTCETCHFEGYVDGRTHHTGRGDVHATTKPLRGLFENRPHFSRALDPDLSSVAENEFRVAGAHSGTDPHFTLDAAKTPWIRQLRLGRDRFDPTELRVALMSFLMTFRHRTNPSVAARLAHGEGAAFTDEERAGSAIFAARCEGCHQARAAADQPASRVPFERWEPLVLSEGGPLVWASDAYAKTGVVPYVNEAHGARVPSLRRLYKKRPYFTNGSAKTLDDVLARARFHHGEPAAFTHDGTTDGEALSEAERRALAAFLDLL
jgi:hypothetical protein